MPKPERSPFVVGPGVTHDIFISYAHVDNEREDRVLQPEGWINRFYNRLDVQLHKALGEPVNIWFDQTDLRCSDQINPAIGHGLQSTEVFVVLISNRSLQSASCRDELRRIQDLVSSGKRPPVGTQARVFPVLLYDIEPSLWPDACRGASGFKFFRQERGRPDEPLDPAHPKYDEVFDKLVDDLRTLLIALRHQRRPPRASSDQSAFRVLLTTAPGARGHDRRELAGLLESRGMQVSLPDIPPPYSRSAHQTAFRDELQGIDLAVHLLDGVGGGAVEGADAPCCYPEEQCSLAHTARVSQLVILPEILDVEAAGPQSHQDFIRKLLDGKWDDGRIAEDLFLLRERRLDAMADKVSSFRESQDRARAKAGRLAGGETVAFVDTCVRDLSFVGDLVQFLEDRSFKPVTVPTKTDSPTDYGSLFAENVIRSAVLIIVFGDVKRTWVKARLQRAVSLIIERDLSLKPIVCIAPPTKPSEETSFPQWPVADCRDGFSADALSRALEGARA